MMPHRLFVPRAPRRPSPLLVALHGCTQTPRDFAAGTGFDALGEELGTFVLYPEQSPRRNLQRCWNWFTEPNQSRGGGEPAGILELVADVIRRHPIDERRVFVVGLSAGGSMAAILAEQAPDVFAAVGIAAGVPLHAAHDVRSARRAMAGDFSVVDALAALPRGFRHGRLRATIWTGLEDRVVAPAGASLLARQFGVLTGVYRQSPRLEVRTDAEIERWRDWRGRVRVELWRIPRLGHAWSGGSPRGSHTDPSGPTASEEMVRFFLRDGTVESIAKR
jgi:poly(hydroxyalkanoate) depolymerase family esterase